MNKGIGALIVGILAVIAGAFVATVLLKKKLSCDDDEADFDSYEDPVDDEEFEHFFGDEDESSSADLYDADMSEENSDDDKEETEEQL